MDSEEKANNSPQVKRFFWMYFVFAAIALIGGTASIYYRINGVTPALLSVVGNNDNTAPNLNDVQKNLEQIQQNANTNNVNVNLLLNTNSPTNTANVTTTNLNSNNVNDINALLLNTNVSNATVNSANTGANLNATQLRSALSQSGIPASQLQNINDSDLTQLYQQALQTQATNTNSQ